MNYEDINLSGYEDVESDVVNDILLINDYMKDKIESAKSDAEFIKSNIYSGKPLRVCEIGSGNSKLLFTLEN